MIVAIDKRPGPALDPARGSGDDGDPSPLREGLPFREQQVDGVVRGVEPDADRDRVGLGDDFSFDVLDRNPIDLVIGGVTGGGGVHGGAVLELESGEDRLAHGFVSVVELAVEKQGLADDGRRWWDGDDGNGGLVGKYKYIQII